MSVSFLFLWHISEHNFHWNSRELLEGQGMGNLTIPVLNIVFGASHILHLLCQSCSGVCYCIGTWWHNFSICSMIWLFRMVACVHNLGMIRFANARGTCYTKIIWSTCVWFGCICACSLKAVVASLKFELFKVEHLDFEGSGEGSARYNYLCHLSKPEKPAQGILACSLYSIQGCIDNILLSLSITNKRTKTSWRYWKQACFH